MCKGETSTVSSLHTVGSRVWLADGGEDGWIKGEVVKIENDTQLTVLLEDGSEKVCDQADVPLQNPGMSGVEVGIQHGFVYDDISIGLALSLFSLSFPLCLLTSEFSMHSKFG